MKSIRTDHRTLIAGQSGTGKTTFIEMLVRSLTIPLTLYDPLDQYTFLPLSPRKLQHRVVPEPDNIERFERECKRIWDKGNELFIIEECEIYMPYYKPLTDYANRCILRGRNKGIGMWFCTRRLADLHKTPISQSNHLFLFKMFLPNDIRYIGQFTGREVADKLKKLPDYHIMHYCDGESVILLPVEVKK